MLAGLKRFGHEALPFSAPFGCGDKPYELFACKRKLN
jgi:hypothetical protein